MTTYEESPRGGRLIFLIALLTGFLAYFDKVGWEFLVGMLVGALCCIYLDKKK